MDERLERNRLRSAFNKIGWTLVLYYLLMNVCVIIVTMIDATIRMIFAMVNGTQESELDSILYEVMTSNGWGYMLAVAIGLLILRFWKGKDFFYCQIWHREKPMDTGSFLSLLAFFVSGQLAFFLLGTLQETILNLFGYSAMAAFETATMDVDSFSMFLYVGIVGPVAEELLFRGFLLRSMQPYGKRFAILTSALLFGVFHGNIVQSPYAFLIGLVLGYTAIEHSIVWAIVLHMFNNLVLSQLLNRLTDFLPEMAVTGILTVIIIGFSVAAFCIAVNRRAEIVAYIRGNKVDRRCVMPFFTAAGIIVFLVMMQLAMLLSIQSI